MKGFLWLIFIFFACSVLQANQIIQWALESNFEKLNAKVKSDGISPELSFLIQAYQASDKQNFPIAIRNLKSYFHQEKFVESSFYDQLELCSRVCESLVLEDHALIAEVLKEYFTFLDTRINSNPGFIMLKTSIEQVRKVSDDQVDQFIELQIQPGVLQKPARAKRLLSHVARKGNSQARLDLLELLSKEDDKVEFLSWWKGTEGLKRLDGADHRYKALEKYAAGIELNEELNQLVKIKSFLTRNYQEKKKTIGKLERNSDRQKSQNRLIRKVLQKSPGTKEPKSPMSKAGMFSKVNFEECFALQKDLFSVSRIYGKTRGIDKEFTRQELIEFLKEKDLTDLLDSKDHNTYLHFNSHGVFCEIHGPFLLDCAGDFKCEQAQKRQKLLYMAR